MRVRRVRSERRRKWDRKAKTDLLHRPAWGNEREIGWREKESKEGREVKIAWAKERENHTWFIVGQLAHPWPSLLCGHTQDLHTHTHTHTQSWRHTMCLSWPQKHSHKPTHSYCSISNLVKSLDPALLQICQTYLSSYKVLHFYCSVPDERAKESVWGVKASTLIICWTVTAMNVSYAGSSQLSLQA